MTLSNTTNAGVTMSIKRVTFLSFFWYFLVRVEIIPLAITPVRDAAPKEMPTGSPTNVANVATLDIPVATLIPLEQALNHVSRVFQGQMSFDIFADVYFSIHNVFKIIQKS